MALNCAVLEKPFPPELIKQRAGNFGTLDYIEGHAVIQRLNEALEGMWSFEIINHHINEKEGEVLVIGKLTVGNIVKMQFGSSQITKAKQSGEIISIADDLKAAATDSLKKCATQMGVGLYLYGKDKGSTDHVPGNGNGTKQSPKSNGNGNGNGNGRLSAKQHNYILKLMAENSITRAEFDRDCVERYGSALDYLSKNDASAVIAQLLNLK
jgi:recombination DNA repair RAD52 pathway protein